MALAGILGGVASGVSVAKDTFGPPAITAEKVNELARAVDGFKEAIKPLANSRDVEALGNRMGVLENRVTTIEGFDIHANDKFDEIQRQLPPMNWNQPIPNGTPWKNLR